MSTVTVYTPSEGTKALAADPNCFKVMAKKEQKSYKGAFFLNNHFANMERNGVNKPRADAWFNVAGEIPIGSIIDPAMKKAGDDEYKPTISFKKSAAPEFGKFLETLEPQWQARIAGLITDKTIKADDQRKTHGLMQYVYGKKHEKAGEALDEPVIRLKVDFNTFPDKYYLSFLSGKPKTQIFDFEKPIVENGVTKYAPATITNDEGVEEAVSFANLHKFITRGSVAKRMRIDMSSTCVSQYWISLQMHIQEIVIQRGVATGFDEDEIASGATETATSAHVEATPVEATPVEAAPETAETAHVETADDKTAAAAIAGI
tara:strand:+ start:98236 stop:99189 length:954 start_codon:yes stop_codon:yes gene_type:complete